MIKTVITRYLAVIFIISLICGMMFGCTNTNHNLNRGIGVYPGAPDQDYSPVLETDNSYRNLAMLHPTYHSSSYDYNLTAQLITDGIIDNKQPKRFSTSTSNNGPLKKNEREWLLDNNSTSKINFEGTSGWVQVDLIGVENVTIDSISFSGRLDADPQKANNWKFIVLGSNDGASWTQIGRKSGPGMPGQAYRSFFSTPGPTSAKSFDEMFNLSQSASYTSYRIQFNAGCAESWSISDIALYSNGEYYNVGGPFDFTSAWMSGGNKTEWVYVDLGAECSIDHIVLNWVWRAIEGSVQISDNAEDWQDIQDISSIPENTDDFKLDTPVQARYVRVLMTKPVSPLGYLLSEMQVFGKGGPRAVAKDKPVLNNGRFDLVGSWKLQRENLVNNNGKVLSKTGYKDDEWLTATVPATVLMSYYNAGCIPDPNYADNQLMLSESFFYSDFWYRTEFKTPSSFKGQRMYLNFDGINWKANIFVNGEKIGDMNGAFTRGKFDVTDKLIPGKKNALAVRIIKNATPGMVKEQTALHPDINGGSLGGDNPTFHASVGWDWIPTIRGRNIGIWNDVYVTTSGPVTLEDPFVSTDLPLPDTTSADVNIEVTLVNHIDEVVEGKLSGSFGDVTFEHPITLTGLETKLVKLSPSTHSVLKLENPDLWWPKGYGKQNLYDVELIFTAGDVSDSKTFKTGVREMTFAEVELPKNPDATGWLAFLSSGNALKIWVNGRRFVGFGGNWGFPESNLSYRDREYDIAVRYHSDMSFTMIRNWVGQTGDEEFYKACDKYGVMVWQDFWLANPADGPNPYDPDMFLDNALDYVKNIRNHPSIGLYCGRNEGNPPEYIDNGLREIVANEHKGLHYISNSSMGVVSGGGPYRAMPIKSYFKDRATPKMHSEMGMPNVVTLESLKKMVPDSALWPQGRMWGLHDYCLQGAQSAETFNRYVDESFGSADNLEDWMKLAQFINYQGYRAMFESQSKHRMGLLLWMSHSAWPSFVWQTYDYYFEPTAAYFGCKKACEPLHIQWNALTDSIEVVNYHARDQKGLTATVELINLDGKVKWDKSVELDSKEDSTAPLFSPDYPKNLSDTYFMRLCLKQGENILSENYYWRGVKEGDFTALRDIPKVNPDVDTKVNKHDDEWLLSTKIENDSKHPIVMVRLKVIGDKSGERILPVMYSDNYITLMPGQERVIDMSVKVNDSRGEKPQVVIEGLNIAQ